LFLFIRTDVIFVSLSGIIFIGPGPEAMHTLGDKISSTLLAQCSGVRTLPWSGSHITIEPTGMAHLFHCALCLLTFLSVFAVEAVTEAVCTRAAVWSVAEAMERADAVGFPLMVKASEGGGGRGIRRAQTVAELPVAFRQVQAEVPGSPIFLMQLATSCRHLEVQVLGDAHGTVVSLSGRDCSVQRRHQKIIEEGPPINVDPQLWEEMQDGAVRLARAVGYRGAGTVEYLYSTGKYCFLELNPRLQGAVHAGLATGVADGPGTVEHPVTEAIMGVNLPACQLQVAMGIPLYRCGASPVTRSDLTRACSIPDVRRAYGFDPAGTDAVAFPSVAPPPSEHCIAARITVRSIKGFGIALSGVVTACACVCTGGGS
jgi:biotin carboxylase